MILGLCSSSALTNLILSITVLVCGRFLVSISSDHMTMVLQLRLQLCRSPGTSNPWTKVGCVVLIWFRCKKQHWCNDIHNATKNYSQRVGILLGPLSLGITYTGEMCSCIAPITLWHICHEEFFLSESWHWLQGTVSLQHKFRSLSRKSMMHPACWRSSADILEPVSLWGN